MKSRRHYLFKIETIFSSDGSLVVLEENKEIPFNVKRIFYEYGLENSSLRGCHANRNSCFCMVAVSGSCDVVVDDGNSKTTYTLDNPNTVLYLDNMLWKTMMNFSKNCVLLILSNCLYDKDEYIRDYDAYRREVCLK